MRRKKDIFSNILIESAIFARPEKVKKYGSPQIGGKRQLKAALHQ